MGKSEHRKYEDKHTQYTCAETHNPHPVHFLFVGLEQEDT